MFTDKNSAEDAGTGLKTAPFQCQGKREGVNEGLGEGAYGRVRGERVGRHSVKEGDGGSRPGDKAETGRLGASSPPIPHPHK